LILKAANPLAVPVPLAEVAAIIKATTAEWTPELLQGYIASNHVPHEWVERLCGMIDANPSLIRVEKPEFLAGSRVARPDLYPYLTTPAGDAWLERCMLDLGKTLFVTPFLRLLAGG
jgi:hypothetical protein